MEEEYKFIVKLVMWLNLWLLSVTSIWLFWSDNTASATYFLLVAIFIKVLSIGDK